MSQNARGESSQLIERLQYLMLRRQTGEMDEKELRELESLLSESVARELYIKMVYEAVELASLLAAVDEEGRRINLGPLEGPGVGWSERSQGTAPSLPARSGSEKGLLHKAKRSPLMAVMLIFLISVGGAFLALLPVVFDQFWKPAAIIRQPTAIIEEPREVGAYVVRIENEAWEAGFSGGELEQQLSVGSHVRLQEGVLQLQFVSGAMVIIEGPAAFRVDSPDSGELISGSLASYVPPEAIGFTVIAGGLEVVDMGTEFSLKINEDETADVQVRRGEVVARNRNSSVATPFSREIFSNQAVRIDASNAEVSVIEFDGSAFDGLLEHSGRFIAYSTRAGVIGNQHDPRNAAHGHDFVVQQAIEVTHLGVFDSGGDGFKSVLTAELWSRDDNGTPENPDDDRGIAKLAELTFTPEHPGELVAGDRFKALEESVELPLGAYTIIARGYGRGDQNINMSTAHLNANRVTSSEAYMDTDDGNGAISFVGTGRWSQMAQPETFPTNVHASDDGTTAHPFAAGTFEFSLVNP